MVTVGIDWGLGPMLLLSALIGDWDQCWGGGGGAISIGWRIGTSSSESRIKLSLAWVALIFACS